MIISRTPLRMSFVGGGSDLPVFYRRFGGAVVSTAIDQYVYITVNKEVYFISHDGHLMPQKKDQSPPDLRYFNIKK